MEILKLFKNLFRKETNIVVREVEIPISFFKVIEADISGWEDFEEECNLKLGYRRNAKGRLISIRNGRFV